VDQNERNRLLAEEFRKNGGFVDEEKFKGAHLLLLTAAGRKSGKKYTTPMQYMPDGERYVVFASHQGAPEDPDWCKNLVAAGTATVEVGDETHEVRAEVVSGSERDELWKRHVERQPGFGEYERKTTRVIPVIALYPIS